MLVFPARICAAVRLSLRGKSPEQGGGAREVSRGRTRGVRTLMTLA